MWDWWKRNYRRVSAGLLLLNGVPRVWFGGERLMGVASIVIAVALLLLDVREHRRERKTRLSEFD